MIDKTREAREIRNSRSIVEAGVAAGALAEFGVAIRQATEANARCPITRETECKSRQCELHYMDAPLKLASKFYIENYTVADRVRRVGNPDGYATEQEARAMVIKFMGKYPNRKYRIAPAS